MAAVDRSQSLKEAIRAEAERLGFAACGFTRADANGDAGLDLERWLAAGHHGTMGWMEDRSEQRSSPLAGLHGEADAVDRALVAEILDEVGGLDCRLAGQPFVQSLSKH